MIGGMWTKQDVAYRRGVNVMTISRYLAVSRARLRTGQELRPMDIPPPDATVDGRPVWEPGGAIAVWLLRGRNNQTTEAETRA